MIFVTVGTTISYDRLIEVVDSLVGGRQISEHVVCQIGNGKYIPKNCEFFRFQKSIDDWIEKASLVISHGGTGTVLSLVNMKIKFIAVANPQASDDHQEQFLSRLGKLGCLLWTKNLDELYTLIQRVTTFKPLPFNAERLTDDLKKYIDEIRK